MQGMGKSDDYKQPGLAVAGLQDADLTLAHTGKLAEGSLGEVRL